MKSLRVENLEVKLGKFHLYNISLEVRSGETLVILGPSGAGKTVLLETIAGFHRPLSGKVILGKQDITYIPPERRNVGFIFQDYALFPHLTIRENILFGARYRYVANLPEKFTELANMLSIEGLLERYPETLSGGEKQRVSLARALIIEPAIMLFDEPLAALDARLRDRLREELLIILKHMNQTTMYVTHDRIEAAIIADRIAVMQDSEIVQTGGPDEIFYQPESVKVAQFTGVETITSGIVTETQAGLVRLDVNGATVVAAGSTTVGKKVTLCLRGENVGISLHTDNYRRTSIRNRLPGRIVDIVPAGPVVSVRIDCGFLLTALITRQSLDELKLKKGIDVTASFKAVAVHILPQYSG